MSDTGRGIQTFAYRFALCVAASEKPRRQLASELGYAAHTTIGRIGDRAKAPDEGKLERYAAAFGTTRLWLAHGIGDPPAHVAAFLAAHPGWQPGTKSPSKRIHPNFISLLKQLNEHEFPGSVSSEKERQVVLDTIAKLAAIAAQPTNGDQRS